MTIRLDPELVEPFVGGLLGACDIDGGPTDEQVTVIGALTTHVWDRPDIDVASSPRLGPTAMAAVVTRPDDRRRFHEMLVTVEACRHPFSAAQLDQVERYTGALGVHGPEMEIFRDLVTHGTQRAADDYTRFLQANLAEREEPSLRDSPALPDSPEPELVARLEAMEHLPAGSLGRACIAFYLRHGLAVPGREASSMNHFFVAHDMTHVIAGIEPTGPGEIALSAFQMAMNDNAVNRSALLASLVVHEVGIGNAGKLTAEAATLADPAAAELLAFELARGSLCTSDFSLVDHLAMAHLPLAEVRSRYGVRPPADPFDGHHHW
jgi:hypothetical protein